MILRSALISLIGIWCLWLESTLCRGGFETLPILKQVAISRILIQSPEYSWFYCFNFIVDKTVFRFYNNQQNQ